jgi:hypothetical protein
MARKIKSYFINKNTNFNIANLNSRFLKENFSIEQDAILGFVGPEIIILPSSFKKVITKNRLHFIIKHNNISITETNLIKLLFGSIIKEAIGLDCERKGSEIFWQSNKLGTCEKTIHEDVSLIHFKLFLYPETYIDNIIGLLDIITAPKIFAIDVMNTYISEIRNVFVNDTVKTT